MTLASLRRYVDADAADVDTRTAGLATAGVDFVAKARQLWMANTTAAVAWWVHANAPTALRAACNTSAFLALARYDDALLALRDGNT